MTIDTTRRYLLSAVCLVVFASIGVYMFLGSRADEIALPEQISQTDLAPVIESTTTRERSIIEPNVVATSATATTTGIPIALIHSEYAIDVRSPASLVAWADNIFVAKIIAKAGDRPNGRVPQTQYTATILANIKGEAKGVAMINQSGVGYSNGKLFANEGDVVSLAGEHVTPEDVFLKEGEVYVFVTGYDEKNDWHVISTPPYDREFIAGGSTLSPVGVLNIVRQDTRSQELVRAARELGELNPTWDK